ncbi:MAG: tetratricopeptide repeat protein [Candidatus Krumholzibacteriia bacterium]
MTLDTAKRPPRPEWIAGLLFVGLALAHILAGLRADPRTWGVHQLAFLPRSVWLLFSLCLVLLAVPAVAARVAGLARILGAVASRSTVVPLGVALVAAVGFYAARLDFPLLGDGLVWMSSLREGNVFYNFEPLSTTLVRFVATRINADEPQAAAGLVSVGLGAVHVFGTALLCRALWRDAWARGLAWLLVLANPALLLFFGYLESYPLLLVLQVLFALTLVHAASGRAPVVLPVAVLSVAIASHLLALSWLPALAALAWVRGSGRGGGKAVVSAIAPLVLALAGALVRVGRVRAPAGALLRTLGGDEGVGGVSLGWMFSWRHASDLLNEMLLLLGPCLLLGASAWGRGFSARLLLSKDVWSPIVWLLPGPLSIALLVEPRIGGARDWDLYVPLLLPVLLACVEAWRATASIPARRRAQDADVPWLARLAAGRAAGLALVGAVSWLLVTASAERSARRLEVLQDRAGYFSNFARGYANETLAVYRHPDPEAARAAWLRATRANPNNARYFNNLAAAELRLKRTDAACEAFRRSFDLGMQEWFVLYNLGGCEIRAGKPEAAEELYDESIRRWPDRWEGRVGRAQARLDQGRPAEALEDLRRAASMAPDQASVHYRIGLAQRDLGRTDEARAAWERALRIDPDHPEASRRLGELRGDTIPGSRPPR